MTRESCRAEMRGMNHLTEGSQRLSQLRMEDRENCPNILSSANLYIAYDDKKPQQMVQIICLMNLDTN